MQVNFCCHHEHKGDYTASDERHEVIHSFEETVYVDISLEARFKQNESEHV